MVAFKFKNVCLEAFAYHLPENIVSSSEIEDRLAPLYQKLEVPFGTLERVSGIKNRRMFETRLMPSAIGTVAVKEVLEKISFDPKEIGMMINCSVCRDTFEPATACIIHNNLRMPQSVVAFDITNACVGMSTGLMMLGQMIEAGTIKAGILVSGENPGTIVEANFKNLLKNQDTITRDMLLKVIPTFTLGGGGVAYVLCHESLSKNKHHVVGGASLTDSGSCDLCVGNGDLHISSQDDVGPLMQTESGKLMAAAAILGGKTWKQASEALGWEAKDLNHIFCHQVGKQVNESFYRELGLPMEKEFTIYKELGNMVSSAMPIAFAMGSEQIGFKSGDKLVCTAYGSGLNSVFYGIRW